MNSILSDVLIRLFDAIDNAATLHEIHDAALDGVRQATGIERASILLFDADGLIRFKAWSGLSSSYCAAVEGYTPWAQGAPPPDPVVVPDVEREPTLAGYRGVFARERIASLAFVPIVARRRVIGTFVLYHDLRHPFTDGEIPAALTIGYQIGFAVERARASREEAVVRERLMVLTDASRRLLTSLAVEPVVDETLSLARQVVAADAYAVWQREGETWRVAASCDLTPEFIGQVLHDDGRVPFDAPLVSEDVIHDASLDRRRAAYAQEGIQSLVSIPLPGRGGPAGSIVFYYRSRHKPSDMELRVAGALGHLAAASIGNARLFGEVQEANRLKDEFLATLSHELRTPLNVILGRTRMLVGAAGDIEVVRQTSDTIERNANVLARLVDDLLDVSRITLGQVKLELQHMQISDVIVAAVAGVEPTARAKAIRLEVLPLQHSPMLLGDPTRLQQVLWNLLSNAIKFTPYGGRVTVSVRRDSSHVVLAVNDTGQGIASDFLPHVFDMFRQGEPATTRHFGGLGLGLSIVRRLVELHGGFVTAESRGLGQGATFSVSLPVPTLNDDASARATGREAMESAG